MSEASVKPAAALPKGDGNGLTYIAKDLIHDRKKIRVGLILFDCAQVTENTDDDAATVKVRIRRAEVLTNPDDAAVVERILMRAFERRSGNTVLPFDLEADVEAAFADINPDGPTADSNGAGGTP